MQQLTAEDREIIFGLYIGSQFKYNTGIGTVCGKTIDAVGRYSDNKHQLILRHISKISDEDMFSVCKIADNGVPDNHVFTEKERTTLIGSMKDAFDEGVFDYRIADYLRSKSYMLPYHGIDLFEAAIAIEQP